MLKFNKVLLASDFDNTLVYTQGALERGEDIPPMSARNREAVEYFIQNGGYFSISTGRALPAFARYAKDLPCNAPCVIANGAAIYDFNKDCYVETAFLDADIYDHVDALLARFPGLCFEIYHDDRRIHVLHPNDYTRNHEHLTRAKTEEVKDFREVDLPIIKLLFEEEKPLLEQVRDFIVSRDWGKRYELIFSSDHLLELTRRGATKGGMILNSSALRARTSTASATTTTTFRCSRSPRSASRPKTPSPRSRNGVRTSSATARTARWRTWWKFSTSDINLKKMAEPSF